MPLTCFDAETVRWLARAMLTASQADGSSTDQDRRVIAHAVMAMGMSDTDVPDTGTSADALAAAVPLPAARRLAIELMTILILAGEATPAKAAELRRFARALSVDEPAIEHVEDTAAGRHQKARRDFRRRYLLNNGMRPGAASLWLVLRILAGHTHDPALLAQYEALAELADDTLGKHYWIYAKQSKLPFPGQKRGGVFESNLYHDISHLIGDYPMTPAGELAVSFFTAGYRRLDGFDHIVFALYQFHRGVKISIGAPTATRAFAPDACFAAWARGSRMTEDLSTRTEFWSLMTLPLHEVRATLGVI
ncbi:hypothetical protein [Burkholderia ubonensis]|uniref:Uncharacterized protein n=1 Tax=Burkholderia ubonensis TaxID=101571 RepID=A0ABD4E6T6_9BURK|nr:hypothetical protein [Burkholderia ubonensis]KVN88989.1 hypothetical protein WJ68_05670 [Burkholderia ubonensis]